MKHFGYDPFSILGGRDKCTVGTLRANAAGHDVSMRSVAPSNIGQHATRAVDLAVPGND